MINTPNSFVISIIYNL